MLKRIEKLYNELQDILDNAPDESDCRAADNDMFGYMELLANSIQKAGYNNVSVVDLYIQTYYCPLTLNRNDVKITDPKKIIKHAYDIRTGIELYKHRDCCDLTEYFDAPFRTLRKIYSIDIDVTCGRDLGLYGGIIVALTNPLTQEEESELKDYIAGQLSDGWGEGFEQYDIGNRYDSMFLSFWRHDDWWLLNEEEFEQKLAENRQKENKEEFPW